MKLLPEDRGRRMSFNIYPNAPENSHCPPEDVLHGQETTPIAASNRANGWTNRGNFEPLGLTDGGDLVLYPRTYTYQPGWCFGSGTCPGYTSEWDEPRRVGTGWGIFNQVFSPGDFDGDGNNDILARDSRGDLYLYPGDGDGGWLNRSVVGTGWNIFDTILGPGDFDGDGNNDILARNSRGELILYAGDGHRGWKQNRVVGTGWQVFNKIVAPGDITGDGAVDVFARDTAGYLRQYPGNGRGGWQAPSTIGGGWQIMTEISGIGSYGHNLEGATNGGYRIPNNDIIAIDPDGDLLDYRGDFFSYANPIGNGWDIFKALI